jgi:acetoin utilization deacetylase AcuC-like enzyme
MGAHHPECPDRLGAISDRLIASGLDVYLQFHDAPLAEEAQLLRVHPRDYVDHVNNSSPAHGIVHLDPDTAMSPELCRRRCVRPAPAATRPIW